MNTLKTWLPHTQQILNNRLELALLLLHVLNKPQSFLYAHPEYELTSEQLQQLETLVQQRVNGKPMAYILGQKEFWSLNFTVNEYVLIPRPETELLVETALQLLPNEPIHIADLGTGSGAIAIALAHERPNWQVIATDHSIPALQVAQHNAKQNNIYNIQFKLGSWCDALPKQKFHAILSNPPYIAEEDPHLQQGDLRFEPISALHSPNNGMADIATIATQARDYLLPGGLLMLEHGYQQGAEVRSLLQTLGYQHIQTKQDLAGLERVTFGILFKKHSNYPRHGEQQQNHAAGSIEPMH